MKAAAKTVSTVEMTMGGRGRFVVNAGEVKDWEGKGAKQVGAEPEPEALDWSSMNVPDLKELAEEAGIEGFSAMKRDELIEALEAAGAEPSVTE